MTLKIYNTLTRKKETFDPLEPGHVTMYVCGPTVYDKAHIGHGMSAIVFDIIRRYLEFCGYQVKYAMNFTDVDDKIIRRAHEKGKDPFELAEGYIREYRQNMVDLNILPATVNPRATGEIEQIIHIIQGLIDKGYAYEVDGDVYFRVSKDEDYGKLSGRRLEDMLAGARIEVDERKETPMDFALWKSSRPGEPYWGSPWGQGRPGWHIECSAMNLEHLGEQIDIHGGGNDLIFPHHENEIAQTESFTGKPFARYWIHNGMLQFSGEKMSKSLGNLITIEQFLSQHDADILRLTVINSGYRNPLTFNDDVVEQAGRAYDRLMSALRLALPGAGGLSESGQQALQHQMDATRSGYIESMDDDFNTAGALGYMFELVRTINQARADGANDAQLKAAQDLLRQLTAVLGLRLEQAIQGDHAANAFINLLVELRRDLRSQKLYALGDKVRNELLNLGVLVEDTKEGSTWRWK